MKRLREKLHSQSGASILLALLLFLTCCMVAASILAAAASNAGKVRSSRVEQQKQLTLSSAIELVCGQIKQATYTGKYKVHEWTDQVGSYTYTDGDGKEISVPIYEDFFYCQQTQGKFACGELAGDLAGDLLPLGKELDAIFGEQFNKSGYGKLTTNIETNQVTHRLTVTLPDNLDGYPSEVPSEVTVEVKLNHDTGHITVTAWLGGGDTPPADGANVMSAELVAVGAPVLDYNPAGRSPGSSAQGTLVEDGNTNTVKWKLNWIKKGADG